MVPSVSRCYELMDEYQMLSHIKAHSVMVCRVAMRIADGLIDAHLDIELNKVVAGALLHDIGKTPSLETGEDHAALGEQICLDNGLYEIAPIVGEHVSLKNYHLNGALSEKEVVYYADKRVKHDQIVTLKERQDYIIERYGRGDETVISAIIKNFGLCERIEEKLFEKLKFSPESLLELNGAEPEYLEADLELSDTR